MILSKKERSDLLDPGKKRLEMPGDSRLEGATELSRCKANRKKNQTQRDWEEALAPMEDDSMMIKTVLRMWGSSKPSAAVNNRLVVAKLGDVA
jgi:hypothetical protein